MCILLASSSTIVALPAQTARRGGHRDSRERARHVVPLHIFIITDPEEGPFDEIDGPEERPLDERDGPTERPLEFRRGIECMVAVYDLLHLMTAAQLTEGIEGVRAFFRFLQFSMCKQHEFAPSGARTPLPPDIASLEGTLDAMAALLHEACAMVSN